MGSTGNFLRTLDEAIKNKLSGANIDGNAVPVHYAFPESEFVAAQYPCFTFNRYAITRGSHRKHNYKEHKRFHWYYVDDSKKEYFYQRHPEPYDVFYQIDVHSKYQTHDVKLQEYLLKNFDTYGYLTYLSDYSGVNQTVAMTLTEVLTLDSSGEEGKRSFRKTYRYRVEAWFEYAKDEPQPTIEDIDIHEWDFSDGIKKWTGTLIVSGFAHVTP